MSRDHIIKNLRIDVRCRTKGLREDLGFSAWRSWQTVRRFCKECIAAGIENEITEYEIEEAIKGAGERKKAKAKMALAAR